MCRELRESPSPADVESINSNLGMIYSYRGLMLQSRGFNKKSIKSFEHAHHFSPHNIQPLNLLAQVHPDMDQPIISP